jgi:L-aspartate oxidase
LTDPALSDDLPTDYDAIVVGAGAAGLYAALCLPAHLRIAIISKDPIELTESPPSASNWAQGGIAAVVSPDDSVELHIADTMKAGDGLCDLAAVRFLVENAANCVASLVQMGVDFDSVAGTGNDQSPAKLAMTLEAAHSRPRVLHAADTTGRTVMKTLLAQVQLRANIVLLGPAFALDLWLEDGNCQGISLVYQQQISWLRSAAVILATGGGGQVYAQTTNPAVSTGDGVAMIDRVGGQLTDLEFFQFHPTALKVEGAPRFLISEAVRGEGAHLIDAAGDRFCFNYHPDGELAPRDVVSRAIFSHLQKTAPDPATANVWLDLRPISAAQIQHRFPNIIKVCQSWGIDVFTTPIPVSPAAHYWMGGITTNLHNQTSIPGVYAVGEVSCTGVHGANRLASNSLLECLVFGAEFANIDIPPLVVLESQVREAIDTASTWLDWSQQQQICQHIRQELPKVMWQTAGIARQADELQSGIAQVAKWQQEFSQLPISQAIHNFHPQEIITWPNSVTQDDLRTWAETGNLLNIGRLILTSALVRTESRGGHFRTDFPEARADWQVHVEVSGQVWQKSPAL